jgi:hypothetical protein
MSKRHTQPENSVDRFGIVEALPYNFWSHPLAAAKEWGPENASRCGSWMDINRKKFAINHKIWLIANFWHPREDSNLRPFA